MFDAGKMLHDKRVKYGSLAPADAGAEQPWAVGWKRAMETEHWDSPAFGMAASM